MIVWYAIIALIFWNLLLSWIVLGLVKKGNTLVETTESVIKCVGVLVKQQQTLSIMVAKLTEHLAKAIGSGALNQKNKNRS